MNKKIILIDSVMTIIAISAPMIITETSPKPQQPNCELQENATKEQIE